ncbi:hypothetical protein BC831DRAFT_479364 [Entophlyctis helioformis]|nr:hypothetical protein BC831DRAFT_479364 [Entophlyctis helioformis]
MAVATEERNCGFGNSDAGVQAAKAWCATQLSDKCCRMPLAVVAAPSIPPGGNTATRPTRDNSAGSQGASPSSTDSASPSGPVMSTPAMAALVASLAAALGIAALAMFLVSRKRSSNSISSTDSTTNNTTAGLSKFLPFASKSPRRPSAGSDRNLVRPSNDGTPSLAATPEFFTDSIIQLPNFDPPSLDPFDPSSSSSLSFDPFGSFGAPPAEPALPSPSAEPIALSSLPAAPAPVVTVASKRVSSQTFASFLSSPLTTGVQSKRSSVERVSSRTAVSIMDLDDADASFYTTQVVQDYVSEAPDEMDLAVGDVIHVLRVFEDGWGAGRNATTGTKGIFPVVCLSTL